MNAKQFKRCVLTVHKRELFLDGGGIVNLFQIYCIQVNPHIFGIHVKKILLSSLSSHSPLSDRYGISLYVNHSKYMHIYVSSVIYIVSEIVTSLAHLVPQSLLSPFYVPCRKTHVSLHKIRKQF